MTAAHDPGSPDALLAVAVRAARRAARIQREAFDRPHAVEYKGETDLVTEVDRACEAAIVRTLRRVHPDHDFLLEEGPSTSSGSPYRWVVDPLDGTTNYTHRYPHYCCSIALQREGRTLLGVVLDPERGELFTALRGAGARLNGAPVRVSAENRLIRSLLATGFPYGIRRARDKNLRKFSRLLQRCRGVRRSGSAALDLCYVAAGRLDGYWVLDLAPWDAAAGILAVREAGGRVTDLRGRPVGSFSRSLAVSNGRIHRPLLEQLHPR